MSSVLRISEAASLALHAMSLLAQNPQRPLPTGEMASALHASEAHLAKVLQRLARAGFVKSTRGPRGGFVLSVSADEVTLLDVYEVIDGPLATTACLLGFPVCRGQQCLLGGLLESLNRQVKDYLATTKLAQLVCGGVVALEDRLQSIHEDRADIQRGG